MTITIQHPTDVKIPPTSFSVHPEDEKLVKLIYENNKLTSLDKAFFLMSLEELTLDNKSQMKMVLQGAG